jgi:hypothetical protein
MRIIPAIDIDGNVSVCQKEITIPKLFTNENPLEVAKI